MNFSVKIRKRSPYRGDLRVSLPESRWIYGKIVCPGCLSCRHLSGQDYSIIQSWTVRFIAPSIYVEFEELINLRFPPFIPILEIRIQALSRSLRTSYPVMAKYVNAELGSR
jgi:hypothetical protein